ncbi:MAG: hypothetical protein KGH59_01435 [Candidatus Micrarchaeota archaeon]|nr:hypothetical protein [Candidatus Micrarchaeota archaeon]MDE1804428.1 hypothetical protein [Candidatus Micrarchaeota archaeon]MDE1847204.1 hypothetical protein [Candidatus Micrarchaeota archaeon]
MEEKIKRTIVRAPQDGAKAVLPENKLSKDLLDAARAVERPLNALEADLKKVEEKTESELSGIGAGVEEDLDSVKDYLLVHRIVPEGDIDKVAEHIVKRDGDVAVHLSDESKVESVVKKIHNPLIALNLMRIAGIAAVFGIAGAPALEQAFSNQAINAVLNVFDGTTNAILLAVGMSGFALNAVRNLRRKSRHLKEEIVQEKKEVEHAYESLSAKGILTGVVDKAKLIWVIHHNGHNLLPHGTGATNF